MYHGLGEIPAHDFEVAQTETQTINTKCVILLPTHMHAFPGPNFVNTCIYSVFGAVWLWGRLFIGDFDALRTIAGESSRERQNI